MMSARKKASESREPEPGTWTRGVRRRRGIKKRPGRGDDGRIAIGQGPDKIRCTMGSGGDQAGGKGPGGAPGFNSISLIRVV